MIKGQAKSSPWAYLGIFGSLLMFMYWNHFPTGLIDHDDTIWQAS